MCLRLLYPQYKEKSIGVCKMRRIVHIYRIIVQTAGAGSPLFCGVNTVEMVYSALAQAAMYTAAMEAKPWFRLQPRLECSHRVPVMSAMLEKKSRHSEIT